MAASSTCLERVALIACCAWQGSCNPLGDGTGQLDDPAAGEGWGAPQVLVSGADRPVALGQDALSLYWGDDTGFVRFVSKEGGVVTSVYEDAGATVDVVVDDGIIFWLEQGYGRLQSYSLVGEQAYTLAVGLQDPQRLAIDDTHLYWIDAGTTIMRIPRGGGYAEYFVLSGRDIRDLALDSTHLYYVDRDRAGVFGVPLYGGMEVVLATGLSDLSEVAADGTRVYWTTANGIARLDVTEPTAPTETVANSLSAPRWLTAAGGHLYWTSAEEGTVMRVSKKGGSPETIAAHQDEPQKVVVDTTAVYWVNHGRREGEGSLRKSERY
jgi:hypothetical protein